MTPSLIDNPIILGFLVFVIVRVVKVFDWVPDGKETLWLTMGIAALVGLVDVAGANGLVALPPYPPTGFQDPVVFLFYVSDILKAVGANAGVVLGVSQAIYHTLRQFPVVKNLI